MRDDVPRIVMAGAGPAHLVALRALAPSTRGRCDLTLVAPAATETYSGMVPGIVAGTRDPASAIVPIQQVAQDAGARFVEDPLVTIDVRARIAGTAQGRVLPFDVLSLNLGNARAPLVPAGAAEHAVPVKPLDAFLEAWRGLRERIRTGRIRSLAVIGAGTAGVEIVLAIAAWRQRCLPDGALALELIDGNEEIAAGHARSVRRALGRALDRHGVQARLGSAATAIDASRVWLASGAQLPADAVLLAVPGRPPPLLVASGLACAASGAVAVDAFLRSRSHPFVLAAGDCAELPQAGVPRSGAVSVHQGPVLAHNLLAVAHARASALRPFRARRRYLALIGSGDGRAVLSWGALGTEGAWVQRLKERIDRRWVAALAASRSA